jgi:hypothetical protein
MRPALLPQPPRNKSAALLASVEISGILQKERPPNAAVSPEIRSGVWLGGCASLPLPAREQTQCGEARGEERQGGGERNRAGIHDTGI